MLASSMVQGWFTYRYKNISAMTIRMGDENMPENSQKRWATAYESSLQSEGFHQPHFFLFQRFHHVLHEVDDFTQIRIFQFPIFLNSTTDFLSFEGLVM